MHFAEPQQLNWIWAIVFLGFLFAAAFSWRKKQMEKFVAAPILPQVIPEVSFRRYVLKSILILLVFFLSILALARPQWGFQWQTIKRQGIDILIAIDTSKSMLTADVKPNRLGRSKLAVKDLIKDLKGDRAGLVAFAGEAFLVCPLTVDYHGFLLALNDLNVGTIPRGGTAIARAIHTAISQYPEEPGKYKVLVILTDGENQEGDPVAMAEKAKEKGIRIYCIGIGTKEGELIQIPAASGEGYEFLKDREGQFVKSRLNEGLLAQIAKVTGGAYVRASGAQFGLDQLYRDELSKLEEREIESKMGKKYFERFQFPLGMALVLLVTEILTSERKRA